ncbi:beta-D-glucoside glucohydrolase [Pseudomonas aeruginosa]|nr:beta-D-glucoside glucohydrolase [Pseudomonas aeruginosa]
MKNRDGLLPLKKQGRIAVIGPLAKSQRDVIGSWSAAGVPRQAVSVYQGLANAVGERATLLYAKGANVSGDPAILDYLNSYNPEVEVDPRPADEMLDEALRSGARRRPGHRRGRRIAGHGPRGLQSHRPAHPGQPAAAAGRH